MTKIDKHWTLYVLKLENDKWYVGITSQSPEKRFQEHLHGRKSYWTEKYKPIKIADTKKLGVLSLEDAKAYEDKVTLRYMKEKGVNNVRGGKFTETQPFKLFATRLFQKSEWDWVKISMYFAALCVVFLGLYIFEYYKN